MCYAYPEVLNKLIEGLEISVYIGWLEAFAKMITACSYGIRVKDVVDNHNRICLFYECRRILKEGFMLIGCEAVEHM